MSRQVSSCLKVHLNGRLVGDYKKGRKGERTFTYAPTWLREPKAIPLSRSMPLSPNTYAGDVVSFYFENLLPDSEDVLRKIAERTGAAGRDAYNLLREIGRDCVGALQFLRESVPLEALSRPKGRILKEEDIIFILDNLGRAPLGINKEGGFRISLAGAQEKAAFLKQDNKWLEPKGLSPTTHIFKPEIGMLKWESGPADFTDSVENEFYCLKLLKGFLPEVANAEIQKFGDKDVLVIERFDRLELGNGLVIRLPQEDMCQALVYPPSRKYQSDGGPRLVDILKLLSLSDTPYQDQQTVFKCQILFWLIGAVDGHAKNFSIFLTPENGFRLTPIYDVLSAQPAFDAGQIRHKDYKLAMPLGHNNHYKIQKIHGRHFIETALDANLSESFAREAIAAVQDNFETAFETVLNDLPENFPMRIHESIKLAAQKRLPKLASAFYK